jgi:hypothetical protein
LERRRFGYRRLQLLRREGVLLIWKKLYRLYRVESLAVTASGVAVCDGGFLSGGHNHLYEVGEAGRIMWAR